ncbi:hypothetical protein GGI25_003077 [Coemansia spiralis]|uniref:Uncharacterized protein n=2 Tax=Coemansia TaxID=4863 RepID=A0A9W8KYG2_9FUNG|nr:hypothetical protein BX070DRAFT_50366 [Coemansia spiralis]KAJ1994575.1 hypothetical protein EDC05_001491 [Coemansia umbellata]KAJ2624381.1 hypothetical protein GGI26_001515 [Coemansia sp. RSA 1358]KAJ2677557.1 hypothetical protein GGI25_003077 [Coemansia spiralis]
MRPDPYKQKASRRYQAKHKEPRDFQRDNTSAAIPEKKPQIDEHSNNDLIDDFQQQKKEEEAQTFLEYLEEASHNTNASQQPAAFFKLRAEAESDELGKYTDSTWDRLLHVDMDLLANSFSLSVKEMPLNMLLGFENSDVAVDFPLPVADSNMNAAASGRSSEAASANKLHQSQPVQNVIVNKKLVASDLAPSICAKKQQPKPQATTQQSKQSLQAADDLEAFLDDLL